MSFRSHPESWPRIETTLDTLLDADEEHRAELLDRLAAEEPEVHQQLVDLLAATDRRDFLEAPLGEGAPDLLSDLEATLDTAEATDSSGRRLGPYRLTEPIGRGGMGVVYLAERADRQFEKQVAIKLMPRGMESDEVERRFRAERQILATLEHPGIARLLDGEVTEDGYPYLVMEYVEGQPIDRYCEERELGIGDRLHLFLDVCDAVQYAHQNLVIHRDIKPSNILVTPDGQVKLLDFGIAKLLDPATDTGEATLFQPRTPQYAAPEQIANRPVSTASDVYSLGMLLYRLLTGELPYRLGGLSASEAEAVVEHREPAPPSAVVAASDDGSAAATRSRRRLRGDLDNIVLKALAKEPGRRYATAERLADDIRRYLDGLPVEARKRTWTYAATKFVRRHRLGAAAAAVVAATMVLGVGGVLWQARRAADEARRAQRTASVLAGLFDEANPYADVGREMSVVELLDNSVERVRSELADDPATRTELLDLLGRAYHGQGHFEEAVAVHREALADRQRFFGTDSVEAARSMTSLADSLRQSGESEEARSLWNEAKEIFSRRLGPESLEVAEVLQHLGLEASARGDYEAAERFHRAALRIARAAGAGPTAFIAGELSNLSNVLDDTGRRDEGIDLLRQAIEMADDTYGREHPFTASMRSNLAIRLQNLGEYGRAEDLYREALALKEKALGSDNVALSDTLTSLGRLLMDQGDFRAAEAPIRRAAALRTKGGDENDFHRIATEINLATLSTELGDLARAEAIYRSALSRFVALFGEEHLATARVHCLLAVCLRRSGDLERAEEHARAALAVQERLPARTQDLSETLVALGAILTERGAADEAVPLLRRAVDLLREDLPTDSWKRAEAGLELATALATEGRSADARRQLDEALPVLESRLPAEDARLVRARALRRRLAAELG